MTQGRRRRTRSKEKLLGERKSSKEKNRETQREKVEGQSDSFFTPSKKRLTRQSSFQ